MNEFVYYTFNKENWNYNVDKIFFVIFLGMTYTVVRLFQLNFDVSTFEIFIRILTCPFTVVAFIGFVEAIIALAVKIGLEPGILVESKFKVFKVFFKAYIASIEKVLELKQVYFKQVKYAVPPMYTVGLGLLCGSGGFHGQFVVNGYIKEPDHFK